MEKKKLAVYTLDQIKDEMIGTKGTQQRDAYEFELKVEILGEMIRAAREKQNLTQEELGKLIGVQKAQISKLERNTNNVTLDTVLRVFNALNAKITFKVEMPDTQLQLV
ncbi:MAG: helix-turn-helix transcriptional regulator [Saprospiraceae bacterium]|nr:helix-turn-helix transcriptional regulator [Saprospiraceae bacterium]